MEMMMEASLPISKKLRAFFLKSSIFKHQVAAFLVLAVIFYSPRHAGIDFGSLFCVSFGSVGIFYCIKSYMQNGEKPFWTEIFFGYLLVYSFVLFANMSSMLEIKSHQYQENIKSFLESLQQC